MHSCEESILKNTRMYVEVRYARQTTMSLKESSAVFRFRKGGKNLETIDYAPISPSTLKQHKVVPHSLLVTLIMCWLDLKVNGFILSLNL